MKKLVALILCLSLPFVFIGCNNANNNDKAEDIIVYPDENAAETLGGYRDNSEDNSSGQIGSTYYVANLSSKKFHISTCSSVQKMKDENRKNATDRQALIDEGYSPCSICKP